LGNVVINEVSFSIKGIMIRKGMKPVGDYFLVDLRVKIQK